MTQYYLAQKFSFERIILDELQFFLSPDGGSINTISY